MKDKRLARAESILAILLGLAILSYIVFLVVQAKQEDREAAEFFEKLKR